MIARIVIDHQLVVVAVERVNKITRLIYLNEVIPNFMVTFFKIFPGRVLKILVVEIFRCYPTK